MSAYLDNVRERIKNEDPIAWDLIMKIDEHFRGRGINIISDAIFWDSKMTEEEEKMAILEYELKKGKSLEEAIVESERVHEEMKELFEELDMAAKIKENSQQIKKARG